MKSLTSSIAVLSLVAALGAQGLYMKVAEIPIGGAGGFDYLSVDSAARRLYVTHRTEVVVIDTATNAIVGRIAETPGVHGFAVAATLGKGFATNGTDNSVSIVDLKTLATTMKVPTGANPDALLYEPTQNKVWVFNHTGKSSTVIDAGSGAVLATVPLGGIAETGQADAAIGRVFVNIEDTSTVDVIDMSTHKVVATHSVAPADTPTGMAVDAPAHRVFVGGGKFVVMMDTRTGKVVASAPICSGTDATVYEPSTKTVFVSCRDGHITVARVTGDSLQVVETIDTAFGARTMALDTATHRLYTAAVRYGAAAAGSGTGRGAAVPDSLRVLVFGPTK